MENFWKLLFVIVDDVCVLLVKFVDWFYNMCILYYMLEYKCGWIVEEMMEIYVLLVGCMGMYDMCEEFEDIFFYMFNLEVYEIIMEWFLDLWECNKDLIVDIESIFVKWLVECGMVVVVKGCEKWLYFIFCKM